MIFNGGVGVCYRYFIITGIAGFFSGPKQQFQGSSYYQ
jgi:hypothetical protein